MPSNHASGHGMLLMSCSQTQLGKLTSLAGVENLLVISGYFLYFSNWKLVKEYIYMEHNYKLQVDVLITFMSFNGGCCLS